MSNTGWIKLYRQIDENPIYFEERFTRSSAWIDLLLLANHKSTQIRVRGIEVQLHAGDLFWSQERLGERWKWNEKTVGKFLKELQNLGQISYKTEYRIGIISITNWTKYQDDVDYKTEYKRGYKTEYKTEPNKNDKNDKNDKNKIIGELSDDSYTHFIDYLNELTGRKFGYADKKARKNYEYLVKKKYKREDFKKVITSAYSDGFHAKNNYKYLTPEFLTRPDKFERYLTWQVKNESNLDII